VTDVRGDLAQRIRAASARALAAGALHPIETEEASVDDPLMPYRLRWVSSLLRRAARPPQPAGANPFLPYDPAMHVADLGPQHVLLLNKFPVYDDHVLVVTRAFAEQDGVFDAGDFAGLARLLGAMDGIAFVNSGRQAGASQAHRHLQFIPRVDVPLQKLLAAAPLPPPATAGTIGKLPFRHALVSLPALPADAAAAGALLVDCFQRACAHIGLQAVDGRMPAHNLLLDRRWLLLVPRRQEAWDFDGGRLGLNAMTFAGVVLARDRAQQEAVRRAGLGALLTAVAYPVNG
jgi:ATP adenylyltransferase